MSLETAGFIKDLVSTNPEGTDPKSQGDDHIRMLKAVLKAQFPGFTQGKGINLLEDNVNQLGGQGANFGVINIDTPVPYSCWLAINTGFTGTAPPGGAVADMVLNICWRTDRIYQLWINSSAIWLRRWAGSSWNAWFNTFGLGVGQVWTNVTGSRALGTTYTNDTGRPISVCVLCTGAAAGASSSVSLAVLGTNIAQVPTNDRDAGGSYAASFGTLFGVIPAGATYAVTAGGSNTITRWSELR